MKKGLLQLFTTTILLGLFSNTSSGQQQTIEYNSDALTNGTNGAQLQVLEKGDPDDWARIFFRNDSDNDLLNRWSFAARPQSGAMDNDSVLIQPIVMTHQTSQKFGFGADGTLRINKQFVLPNMDGTAGQVMTTDGAGTVSWQSVGGGGNGNNIADDDGDSEIFFLEGSGTTSDTAVVAIGAGAGSLRIFDFTTGGHKSNRKMEINTNSTPSAPQLRLTETGGADAARLFFTNGTTGNNWIVNGNGGTNLNNVAFNVNYNGASRLSYSESDSSLIVLNEVTAFAPTSGAATMNFKNNQFSNNEFRIVGDPSNTGTENASLHFDWKSPTLERDFMTFTADGNGMDPIIDLHQDLRYGIDNTAVASSRLEVFSDASVSGSQAGIRTRMVNNGANATLFGMLSRSESTQAVQVYGLYSIAEATDSQAIEYGVYADSQNTISDSWGLFCDGNIWYTGSQLSPSDQRLKKNIRNVERGSLDKVMALEVKNYEYDSEILSHLNFPKGEQRGFLAQDLQRVIPEMVHAKKMPTTAPEEFKEGDEMMEILTVEMTRLIPILTSAIQEQQEQIEQLKAENEAFKAEFRQFKEQLEDNKE